MDKHDFEYRDISRLSFSSLLDYQDADAKIKIHDSSIKWSSSIEFSSVRLMEDFKLVVSENFEFDNRYM